MALLLSFILNQKCSLQKSLTFTLIPNISSSLFSTLCCRDHPTLHSSPPVPKKVPFTVSAHGTTWQDPYRWMSNTDDPDLSDHLSRENSYADAFMADSRGLQRTLVSEMTSRMPTKISTPPELWGPWLYYQYIPEGKEYPVLCRRLELGKNGWIKSFLHYARGGFGKEEVLLDWNEIAKKYGYVHVGTCRISPDHHFLAYTLDIKGNEQFILQIKDLRRGCIIPKVQINGVVSLAWAEDSSTLFYTLSDENQRPYRVLCSKLGSDDMDNITVFTENDSSFCVDITSTKDGKFITVNSNSRTSSEVYLIDSTNPLGGLQKVWKRISGVQYFLEHHLGTFYVLTNAPSNESKAWSGEGYYLATCSVEDILSSNWQNIILPSEDFTIQDMDMFNGHLVLSLNKKDYSIFCSIDLPMAVDCKHQVKIEDLNPWFFPLPSNSCTVAPGSNHDFQNSSYRVVLSSPVMPDVVIDYDMPTRRFSVVQQEEVIGFRGTSPPANELDMNQTLVQLNEKDRNVHISESQTWKDFSGEYCCERREVVSHDGVSVPLTVLYSHTAWKKGQSPGLLHGYGAYGEVLDKSWCTDQLSLLDRGWVVAFADVRGSGGDSSWHEAGRRFNKLNSIHDFVSCGNYLIKEGYVHRDQLGAIGCSAGGLLVGATINMYPDLFRAAILKVPFLDVCNTLMDPSLPLTILDYEEFGNPQIKSQFENILSYSPYDNISQGSCYPSMLVRASFHDSRVGFWEAAKWVAKIRDSTCPHCSSSVILKTNMGGGHFGEGGRYAQSEETAYDYAFLIKAMGMLKNEK
uniref:prolyl endopeptidase-like isoform X1 n=1 Tax=Fragaria vesca subsp. vesca TaxID=101020 RepID=UPI0005C804DF|nr:PREDICTED: prolyl endopeptidase-like isoform X1 [Fragaria vesca subsp. vesca]